MSKSYRHSNPELMYAMQEKRRSSSASPERNKKKYRRVDSKREMRAFV